MTQRDVARAAGVSTAVVSAVLSPKKNSSIRVAPETAQRVHEAVQRLGYVPNLVARSLAGGERKLLGVFT
ncbi:LacI family DNA-binding transcriptional regulator [Pseudoroseicyclus tamaricis]|nr:LacI family DNA-binding transcriptional regulator [Pseudoroseicyclus tamaricis]